MAQLPRVLQTVRDQGIVRGVKLCSAFVRATRSRSRRGEMRVPEGPILPHSDFGDPECCGTLWPLIREDQPDTADIICNECETIVKEMRQRITD